MYKSVFPHFLILHHIIFYLHHQRPIIVKIRNDLFPTWLMCNVFICEKNNENENLIKKNSSFLIIIYVVL